MKRAFTFVQVLVAVAATLILAAIFYPIFQGSREIGGLPKCGSNLKQLGLGFLQYTQDYNERFPPARVTATRGWNDAIFPVSLCAELPIPVLGLCIE